MPEHTRASLHKFVHTCQPKEWWSRRFLSGGRGLQKVQMERTDSHPLTSAFPSALHANHCCRRLPLTGSLLQTVDNKCSLMAAGPSHATCSSSYRARPLIKQAAGKSLQNYNCLRYETSSPVSQSYAESQQKLLTVAVFMPA